MSLLSFIVYIPLQIVFLPLAILGALMVGYRQLVISKRFGISQTAIEVLNGRWTMHVFGIRPDEASSKLANTLPNTSVAGLWCALFPLWLKYKISGRYFLYPRLPEVGSEGIADLVVVRTRAFDRMIARTLADVDQFVVMGAGYDTRAYGEFSGEDVTFFELDQPGVQQHKRAALLAAGIASEHVHFVPVDFSSESAFEKLSEAGFDQSLKTLFLWEGVTLYLSESDVRRTIEDVSRHAPAGSTLLADIYADRFVELGKKTGVKQTLDYTDEGLGFGLPFTTDYQLVLNEFVQSGSMSVGEACFLGAEDDKGPFMVVVEMQCQSKP